MAAQFIGSFIGTAVVYLLYLDAIDHHEGGQGHRTVTGPNATAGSSGLHINPDRVCVCARVRFRILRRIALHWEAHTALFFFVYLFCIPRILHLPPTLPPTLPGAMVYKYNGAVCHVLWPGLCWHHLPHFWLICDSVSLSVLFRAESGFFDAVLGSLRRTRSRTSPPAAALSTS